MKGERILNSLNQVDDMFITEAAPGQSGKKRSIWRKVAAAAASLALICAVGFGFLQQRSVNSPYTAFLSSGSTITFLRHDNAIFNLDMSIVGVRALRDAEAGALFGELDVDATIGFEENTLEFIYLEGTIDGFRIKVMRSDISPDTVIDGAESTSAVNGVPVTAGFFLTKVNSQGDRTVIVYASFEKGNYTVYLESSGAEDERDQLCNAMAEEIQKLIETASLNFERIK